MQRLASAAAQHVLATTWPLSIRGIPCSPHPEGLQKEHRLVSRPSLLLWCCGQPCSRQGYPNTNDWRKSVRNFVHSASLALERLDSLEYVMQASGRSSEEVSPSNNVRWTDSYCTICTDIVLQGPLCPRDDRSESPSSTHTVVELLGVTSMIPLPATIPLGENQIATLT
ncbi:hypothetical protein DFH94DRAFT_203611 [Russula ochroleuca]|uniref:Uncharacterized protein n=1 Tax=Russula ochroleuca TaxID=152965 RepID=A0A9P5MPC4_9AGAM|nr:hypothetical protein DFH94DRAFT_203611 [Russula ochroleuca]